MKKTLMRMFTLALLTILSLGARAQKINVEIGTFTGGKIVEKSQTGPDASGNVTVTITVTPDKNYTITKKDIQVVSTYDPENADTRSPQMADSLTLYFNGSSSADTNDPSAERDYTFTLNTSFGAWVKSATFTASGKKGGEPQRGTPTYETGKLDEGFYYIVNNNNDKKYSLCPAENPTNSSEGKWYDNGHTMPFLTTKQGVPDDYRLWYLTKNGSGNYQIIHVKDGKYVINHETNAASEAVHLGALPEGGTNTWFAISYVTSGSYYNIKGTDVTEGNSFNPYTGNKDNYNGGIIGYYDATDNGSKWQFVKVTVLPVTLTITNTDGDYTITPSSILPGQTIYYTTDGSDPRTSDTRVQYTSTPFQLTGSETKVKAVVELNGHYSEVAILQEVSSTDEMTDMGGVYNLAEGFTINGSIGTDEQPFTGIIDGQFNTIRSASVPLVAYASGAIIRNVVIGTASVSGGTNVGAICGEAAGATRIYNCGVQGGTVSGPGYVGSIVGKLDGTSRVINCYSFANVSGGSDVGGIVGYNNVSGSNANNVKTMVMNCMFYGNATGTNISPIYGGNIINNAGSTGLNNFNYFSFEDFTSTITDGKYNCALGAEKRFLTRFEFYRQILNSNRELAAWYVNGSPANSRDVIAKWVLDKSVKPYPILKPHGKYTSIINYDASAGTRLGTLSVTISGTGTNAPEEGASITTSSLTLTRTDKDPDNFNFNYDKVQLPYYNDIGTGNYTDNKVVVGWEITAITGGGTTSYSTGSNVTLDGEGNVTATPYNFADRGCTKKDLYSTTGRVLSQGAYFNVPTGVTAITIEPYWATAVYLADPTYDKTYDNGYGNGNNTAAMGTRYTNGQSYSINGSNQVVYTTMGNAINALGRASDKTVYDYAVVLVGNYHHYYGNNSINNDTKGFTIMSADLDGDNEPDNCFFYQHQQRQAVAPIRFDFLCWPGIGMAQKPSNSPRMPGIGIFKPRGWFEVTNTCLAQFYEFEYDWKDKNAETGGSPLILLGGVYEQITSSNDGAPTHTKYIHIGDNAWFKMFNNGIHADKNNFTPHNPISVTGGDYDKFYLSGMFRPNATASADNAECYISGGRFGEVAGSGMEKINGNVYWQIDHADIEAFYGGGINAAQPVQGNITTDIRGSRITTFCGGPKFGDMASGKTVKTTATNCTFGRYFGAGYGGTSLNRIRKTNWTNNPNYSFNSWADFYSRQYEDVTKMSEGGNTSNNKDVTVKAIATNYEYELFAYAGFADNNNVGRFYVNYASLSLATTHDVTSTLNGCTITGNFYGGGSLGKVDGSITSTLTDCTVNGNAFGAGFSASAPTVDVMAKGGFSTEPQYDGNSGTYTQGVFPATTRYTWKHTDTAPANGSEPFEDDVDKHYILTTADMTTLGTVTGTVSLTIGGNSVIGTASDPATGNVYGGGDESAVSNTTTPANASTIVTLQGNTEVLGNVFGGGNEGVVSGSITVNIVN